MKISQRVRLARLDTFLASIATTMHWSPNFSAASLTNSRPRHRRGVDRHLVGAAGQQLADVVDRAHAAADGQRHEAGLGGARHDVEDGVAVLVARGDVEKAQLVGAGGVIGDRRLDRIAGIAQIDEVDALDDAAVLDVEAGNDADLEHHSAARCAPANKRQRRGGIEPPVIERAAGDRALELSRARLEHRLHVVDRGEAARGDHRNRDGIGQRDRRVQLMPLSMPSRATSV